MRAVNEVSFWKERIAEAKSDPRLSVFQTSEEEWEAINQAHSKVISELVSGRVLDAACGYGRASEWIKGDYVGIDFSPDFINMAKTFYPDKKFIVADLRDGTPFPDQFFDWAVCVSLKAMIEREVSKDEWERMLTELKRIAKKVLILEYSYKDKYEIL